MIPPATNALPRDLFRLITSTAIEVTSQVLLMLEDRQKEPGPGISPDPESFFARRRRYNNAYCVRSRRERSGSASPAMKLLKCWLSW